MVISTVGWLPNTGISSGTARLTFTFLRAAYALWFSVHNIHIILDLGVIWTKVNIMSNINEPFVNDGGRFEVVFVSMASSRYQLRLSILGLFACLLRQEAAKQYKHTQ